MGEGRDAARARGRSALGIEDILTDGRIKRCLILISSMNLEEEEDDEDEEERSGEGKGREGEE